MNPHQTQINELFLQADKLYDNEDYQSAFAIYEKMLALGDLEAQNMLALMLEHGQGVKRNIPLAIKIYKKGWHDTGSTMFSNNLALLYLSQNNPRQAIYWWKKGIAMGDDEPKLELAKYYLTKKIYNRHKVLDLLKGVIYSDNVCLDSAEKAEQLYNALILNQ